MLQITNLHATAQILPGTGRWQSAGLTEGSGAAGLDPSTVRAASTGPSTASRSPSPFRGGFSLRAFAPWRESNTRSGRALTLGIYLTPRYKGAKKAQKLLGISLEGSVG